MPEKSKKPNDVTINSEKFSDNKKNVPNPEGKKRRRKVLFGCLGVVFAILIILILGMVIGGIGWPKISQWLNDHHLISSSVVDCTGSCEGKRNVVVEQNYVINVVNKVKDSVVSIAVSGSHFNPDTGKIDNASNIGTGFVIDASGLILTNQHVVSAQDQTYVVITSDGKEHQVASIARDDVDDLAILKVNDSGLTPVTIGNSDNLQVGQFVIAIGTPLGEFPGSVTTGVVSGLNRSVTAGSSIMGGTSKTYENVIQTDAAINPGNSGGPLLDAEGSVIGINFATTSGADNISFALPINRAKTKMSEYQQNGKFIIPYLGVDYQPISTTDALFSSNVVPGAYVLKVVQDSPAAKGGIQKDDIITEFDGEQVNGALSVLVQKHQVGDTVPLKVWRDGQTVELSVTLEEA